MDLYSLVGNLQGIGFYDILLPWALFFAMCFGLLSFKGPFSGTDKKPVVAIISMAVAFFAVAYTPYGMTFGLYLAEMFGRGGTILAGLLVLTLFLGMAGMSLPEGFGKSKEKTYGALVILIAAIIYFTTGFDRVFNLSSPTFATDTLVTLIVIAIMAGAIYLMMKGDGGNGDGGGDETETGTEADTPPPASKKK